MLHISNKGNSQDIGTVFPLDSTNRNDIARKQNEAKLADDKKRQADKDAQELTSLRASTAQDARTIDSLNGQIGDLNGQIGGLNAKLGQPRAQVLENSNNLDPSYDKAKVLFLSLNSENNSYFALDTGHENDEAPWAYNFSFDNKWQWIRLMKADSKDKASLWRLRSLSDKSESEGGHFVWLQEDKIRIGKPEGQDQDLWKITEYDETFPGWYHIEASSGNKCLAIGNNITYGDLKGYELEMTAERKNVKQVWDVIRLYEPDVN